MQAVNIVVLFFTMCAAVWYTWETRKLRAVNDQMLKLQLKSLQPAIVTYFHDARRFPDVLFRVKNIGGSPAHKIRVEMTPGMNTGENKYDDLFNNNALFGEGLPVLLPGSEYDVYLGWLAGYEEKYRKGELPRKYEVMVSFNDENGKECQARNTLYLDQFFVNRIDPKGYTILEETAIKLEKDLDNLVSVIKGLSKDSRKSPSQNTVSEDRPGDLGDRKLKRRGSN